MAKPSQTVPVVVYENGKRYEVGTAELILDGKNMAIMAEVLPQYSEFLFPDNLQVSLASIDTPDLDEVDRCARAYGWEVGRGRTLVQGEIGLSEDNPFRTLHWRDGVPV